MALDGEVDEIGLVELSSAGVAHLWARPPGSIAPSAAARSPSSMASSSRAAQVRE